MVDLTNYKLTFDDEFNARSISQTGTTTTWSDIRPQWRFDANSDVGFGHSSFVDAASGYDPFNVSGGALSITAVPDRTPFGYPGSWESGLISTEGKFSQTYGYFEMRAQTSSAPGSWDAFWMLPAQPTANQELDVVEHYGNNDPGTYSTIHTSDNTPSSALQVYSQDSARTTGYHTYGMDWEPDRISFYVDGKLMGSQATPSDMHSPMYLLADLATEANASVSSITTKVDYIRAFSKDPSAQAVTQGVVSAPDGMDPGLYGATAATAQVPVTSAATSSAPAPAVSTPAVSTPIVSVPAISTPAVATPAASIPAVSTPAVAAPAVSIPMVSTAAVSTSAVLTPAVSIPVVSTPIASTPAVSIPAVSTSADTGSITTAQGGSFAAPATPVAAMASAQIAPAVSAFPVQAVDPTPAPLDPATTPATDSVAQVAITLHPDGSRSVDIQSPGQTMASSFGDTFLNHGQGANTFIFDPGYGHDIIRQFKLAGADHDVIDLPSSDFAGLADVLRNTQTVSGAAVINDPTTGDTIRLAGISKAQLVHNRSDLVFHP